jgi:hypothetical protein
VPTELSDGGARIGAVPTQVPCRRAHLESVSPQLSDGGAHIGAVPTQMPRRRARLGQMPTEVLNRTACAGAQLCSRRFTPTRFPGSGITAAGLPADDLPDTLRGGGQTRRTRSNELDRPTTPVGGSCHPRGQWRRRLGAPQAFDVELTQVVLRSEARHA